MARGLAASDEPSSDEQNAQSTVPTDAATYAGTIDNQLYWNPPFDTRNSRGTIHASGQRLAMGYLVNAEQLHPLNTNWEDPPSERAADYPGGVKYRLDFLYNPSEIDIAYQLDPAQLQGFNDQSVTTYGVPNIITGQSMGFNLYLYRGYELAKTPPPRWGRDAQGFGSSNAGVLADIYVLEKLMGLGTTDPQLTASDAVRNGGFVRFVFGSRSSIRWTGRISSCDITLTRFARNMVPIECTVALTVAKVYRAVTDASNATVPVTSQ